MSLGLACLLTVLIETAFFALCGYRRRSAVVIVACANVITNLAMNTILALWLPRWTPGVLLVAEAAVVAAEYGIYAIPFGGSRRLFLLTAAANALSCGIGLAAMAAMT